MMRNLGTLVVLLTTVAMALALTYLRPVPLPRTVEVAPSVTSKLVCAPMNGPGVLFVDGADALIPLGQEASAAVGPTLVADQKVPTVIRGGSALLGGTLVMGGDTLAFVPCAAPRSQGTLLVPTTAGTDLLVVNPDSAEAVVDLSLYATDGEVVALGARGIAVGPHSSRVVALSVLVDGEGPVAVEYRASRGRATVVARTDTPGVLDAATSSIPGTEHALAGVPQGATAATVLVTNPGNDRAAVEVTAQGLSVAYQPEGGTGISVPPHSTVAVELAASLAGEATGLLVTSDVDVAVGLSTGTGTDLALSAPVATDVELGAFAPAGGVVQLSNPGDGYASVTVTVDVIEGESTASDLTIPAGTTLTVALGATAPLGQSVAVTSDMPLFGAIVDTDMGMSTMPLASTKTPVVDPVNAEIVPTLR